MLAAWRIPLILLLLTTSEAQTYRAPAGIRPAQRHPTSAILPGGRVIYPLGDQFITGPGTFGLAVSASGRTLVTSNIGPGRNSLTVLDRDRNGKWQGRQLVARSPDLLDEFDAADWRGISTGLVFASDHAVYASEGNSGKISLFDWNSERRRVIDLNQKGFDDSYAGNLALDPDRGILYAVDQANFRVAVIDTKTRQVTEFIKVGRLPFALALSPDRQKLYVTNVGMFQYQAVPGIDLKDARTTALPFPAFGFASAESMTGADRETGKGTVKVPGLGDPNAPESNSVCVIDVSTPGSAKIETFIRTGLPFGEKSRGGSSPSGILATADHIYVSNASNDSITVIDPKSNTVTDEILIRIPGLDGFRGVLPVGMAYHERTGWLLVADAGINAVAVIDTHEKRVLGHLPVGWFPVSVAIDPQDMVYVANAKGQGIGPNAPGALRNALGQTQFYLGSVSAFPLPKSEELAGQTTFVMEANGFQPQSAKESPLPDGIRHVVLIVKESRSYDQVFGDILEASNGAAMGVPEYAKYGTRGYVDGHGHRFSMKDVNITPNHHAIARRYAFSDNFYADSDFSLDGHHWLTGVYPNIWTQSSLMTANSDQKKDFRVGSAPGRLSFAGLDASVQPEDIGEAGTIWDHLARNHVSFYNFGEGFELAGTGEGKDFEPSGARIVTNMPMPDALYQHTSRRYPGFNIHISDQYRATQFIQEMNEKYGKGEEPPQFLFVHLPNDYAAPAQPDDGYPYDESFVMDNDYALGRILEYLSGTKWWKDTAVFITEDDAQGGTDHIDAHRTLLLCASPWCKKDYVSHVNTSFPGLLKTIFRLLHVPPMNLFDATASDLSDMFASKSDPAPWKAVDVDKRIFDPAAVKGAKVESSK